MDPVSSTPMGNVRANWLVAFAIITVSGILLLITFRPITDEFAKNTMLVILGMYLGELKNIYAFEFGTTRRSREKTDIINDALNADTVVNVTRDAKGKEEKSDA